MKGESQVTPNTKHAVQTGLKIASVTLGVVATLMGIKR